MEGEPTTYRLMLGLGLDSELDSEFSRVQGSFNFLRKERPAGTGLKSRLSLPVRTIYLLRAYAFDRWLPSSDRAANRITFLTSHVDDHLERFVIRSSALDLLPSQIVQMNLCSAKHFEVTLLVHHPPGKIEEPFLRCAFGKVAQKVWRPVRLPADPEGRSKCDLLSISRNGFDHFIAFLNSKVHRPSSRSIFKADSRKVATHSLDG